MADLYPFKYAAGERYWIDNRVGFPSSEPPSAETEIPVEGRARITCGVMLQDDNGSPRGRCLVPVTQRAASQYLVRVQPARWLRSPYKSMGLWHLETDGSPRGSILRGHVPIGCYPRELGIEAAIPPGIADNFPSVAGGQRIPAASRLHPFPEDDAGSPRGGVLGLKGEAGCPNIAYVWVPISPSIPEFGEYFLLYQYEKEEDPRGKLYHFDVFGYPCVSCPILFASFQAPCLGCSFRTEDIGYTGVNEPWLVNQCGDPGGPVRTDWCAEGGHAPMIIGLAHCVPSYPQGDWRYDPNYHIACDVNQDGSVGSHHCEHCVYERNLGRMLTEMLHRADWLNKIPMRPVYLPAGHSEAHHCQYGCGEFGWELWSDQSLGRLRLHGRHDLPGGEWMHPGEQINRLEGPCSNPTMDCVNMTTGWRSSGFRFCSTGMLINCGGNQPDLWCDATHHFRWRKDDSYNQITKAHICFRQWEMCDDSVQPCPSNPFHSSPMGSYHNPASDLMVWVDCRIEMQFAFDHWGPRGGYSCCDAHAGRNPDLITVQLSGKFCGPIPWGRAGAHAWYGYESDMLTRIANYPGTFYDPRNADGADARGACGSMFVDQGTYDDFLAGSPGAGLFDSVSEPPQRCPSRLSGPKFWCPPSLDWSWKYQGGSGNWTSWTVQPNTHNRANQCWALQLAKNDGDGCAAGTTHTGTTVGCKAPEGRRGCSMRESLDAYGVRLSPWRYAGATPWGCGHCVDVYPRDPFAPW